MRLCKGSVSVRSSRKLSKVFRLCNNSKVLSKKKWSKWNRSL